MEEHRDGIDSLHPMLRQAHEKLDDALDEACRAKPARDETTGEMIRLEETLTEAAEAAKRAVSIRRRLREEAARDRRAHPEPRGDGPAGNDEQPRMDG